MVYDVLNNTASLIPNRALNYPAWNPKSELLVCIERRTAFGEPVLIKPDGSDTVYLAGDSPGPLSSGAHTAWDSEGVRIAVSNSNFDLTSSDGWDRRIALYDDLYGTPVRTSFPSEEQLADFFAEHGGGFGHLRVGANGICWSPDGEYIVHDLFFGVGNTSVLVKTKVDGSEPIQLLVPATHPSFYSPGNPTYSPDGRTIVFTAPKRGGTDRFHLHTVPYNGGSTTDVTGSSSSVEEVAPAWYGT